MMRKFYKYKFNNILVSFSWAQLQGRIEHYREMLHAACKCFFLALGLTKMNN